LKDLGKIKVADLTAPQRFGHGIGGFTEGD
jgi:hypothetical protein